MYIRGSSICLWRHVFAYCLFQRFNGACVVCGKTYASKQRLRDHLLSKHGLGDPHKCRHCGMLGFKSLYQLYEHTAMCRDQSDNVNRWGRMKLVSVVRIKMLGTCMYINWSEMPINKLANVTSCVRPHNTTIWIYTCIYEGRSISSALSLID